MMVTFVLNMHHVQVTKDSSLAITHELCLLQLLASKAKLSVMVLGMTSSRVGRVSGISLQPEETAEVRFDLIKKGG
jgi:hypothetical protein